MRDEETGRTARWTADGHPLPAVLKLYRRGWDGLGDEIRAQIWRHKTGAQLAGWRWVRRILETSIDTNKREKTRGHLINETSGEPHHG